MIWANWNYRLVSRLGVIRRRQAGSGRRQIAEGTGLCQAFFEVNNEAGGREVLGANGGSGVLPNILGAPEGAHRSPDIVNRPAN